MTKRPDKIIVGTIGNEFCIHGLIQLDRAGEIIKKLKSGYLMFKNSLSGNTS